MKNESGRDFDREMTTLLEQASLEHAPDRWEAIRSSIEPRSSAVGTKSFWWLARHRVQAGVGLTAATVAVAATLLFTGQPSQQLEPSAMLLDHASMSWREPFADKAALGLTQVVNADSRPEDSR